MAILREGLLGLRKVAAASWVGLERDSSTANIAVENSFMLAIFLITSAPDMAGLILSV